MHCSCFFLHFPSFSLTMLCRSYWKCCHSHSTMPIAMVKADGRPAEMIPRRRVDQVTVETVLSATWRGKKTVARPSSVRRATSMCFKMKMKNIHHDLNSLSHTMFLLLITFCRSFLTHDSRNSTSGWPFSSKRTAVELLHYSPGVTRGAGE